MYRFYSPIDFVIPKTIVVLEITMKLNMYEYIKWQIKDFNLPDKGMFFKIIN